MYNVLYNTYLVAGQADHQYWQQNWYLQWLQDGAQKQLEQGRKPVW